MAGELSRVWCMDTAPLCNQGDQALSALFLHLFFLGAPLAEVEPAAGRFQEVSLGFQNLENNQAHSLPKGTVPGTGAGQAAELACRLVGGLSWSLWEVDLLEH